ncbi:MAG: hypothetical protein MPN21_17200 [Thermoanaerobaculia bacterium]|nr:hypothetical protein [Thermoanaerobaculia bacterium]
MQLTRSLTLGLLCLAAPWFAPEAAGLDPAKIVSAEACGECHASTFQVWEATPHATGFDTLHRQQNAYEIAERMGFRLVKRDSMCLQCHYTPIPEGDGLRAVSGVSCESCHGAARDYLDVHNDYGGKGPDGKDLDHKTESPEHRRQRIAASRAAGMLRPSDLYELASTCYGCHTVPNEKLVDVGRHSLGSTDFDLVARTDQIRHNFLDSYLNGDGSVNAERSVAHRRRLAVIGRMLTLEHALRGLAGATGDGVYAKAVQRRLRRATTDLYQVAQAASLDEATSMVNLALAVDAASGERAGFLRTADEIGVLARSFLAGHDGTSLAALDPLLRGEELPFVELPSTEPDEQEERIADSGAPPLPPSDESVSTSDTGSPRVLPAREAIAAEGEKRDRIRPRPGHDTLEVTSCQKCHGDQNAWWFQDRHYASIEPFLDRAPDNVRIARLYGISPGQMARGDSLCMDCHGTVATARAAREVEDGVSCQSCHGAAADYLEVHQAEDGEALGADRPGYRRALQVGMKDLRDLATAVENCASCHYVTDHRLLSSGHPSGEDFDIVSSISKIKHWQTAIHPDAELRQAWAAVQSQRGPVPRVRQARLALPARTETPRSTATPSGPQAISPPTEGERGSAAAGEPPRASRQRTSPGANTESLGLPERPQLDAAMPVDEVLRALQRRLEELYQAAAGASGPTNDPSEEGDGG